MLSIEGLGSHRAESYILSSHKSAWELNLLVMRENCFFIKAVVISWSFRFSVWVDKEILVAKILRA